MPIFGEEEDVLSKLFAMNQPELAPKSYGEMPIQVPPVRNQQIDLQKDYSPQVEASAASPMASAEVQADTPKPDPYEYIRNKYGLDARNKIIEENQKDASGPNWKAAFSALGAGFAGRDAGAAGQAVIDAQAKQRQGKLNDFDKGRELAISDIETNEKIERKAREQDPNSQETMLARDLAKRMLPSFDSSKMTAAQINERIPSLSKVYEIEQRKLDRQEARDERRMLFGMKQQERQDTKDAKREEKEFGLKTPYGLANTEDDAKKLKEAYEAKKNFDSKIEEMIDLRNKYGVEYGNREAVARGKQLSKDLLLEYKNMAKLGVLSQADQAIIDAIIPADPLGQDWAPGQDPIMSNLKKFKEDSDKDFSNRVQTRTREGVQIPVGNEDSASLARQKRIAELRAKRGLK